MAVDLHNASLDNNSSNGGSQNLTITAGAASGTDQPCRSALILASASTVRVLFTEFGTACTSTTGIPCLSTMYLPIPCDNLAKLKFYGTGSETIDIIWRN